MSNAFFVMINQQQTGPLGWEQIRLMAAQGQVQSNTLFWKEGMSNWEPLGTAHPDLFANTGASAPAAPQPKAPPPFAQAQPQTEFEILTREFHKVPKITLKQATVTVEAGAMHYMLGNIQIQAQMPSVGGFIKSKLTKERAVRPTYSGTGDIFLEPTFGEVNLLTLAGEEWILDKGAFLACDATVEVGMYTNKAVSGFFGGEGFFQTSVKGHGKVLFHSGGPLETVDLRGETLTVDGSFAVARTAGLEFRVEKATGKMFSSWMSGEGLVNRFTGHGRVLIAPVPNRFLSMMMEFGGLHHAIRMISRKG